MAYGELFPPQEEGRHVFTVAQITEQVKELLGTAFSSIWVSGEISNFSRPASGHCYFSLKDDRAQLRSVMWRSTANQVRFDLHDGLEVVCQGYIDVYAPRGSYQLIVRQIEPKGLGALELALRQLRAKLETEGLFKRELKRPLVRFPRQIAVITSPTGAAIRDFLEVLRRRAPQARVLIVPVRVQGDAAAGEIREAIHLVNRMQAPIDTIVLTRGGGSLEDLWAFNEEVVVRAIRASRIPVVSAVGHEIDVTLSDLAADLRALTPSEAAERVFPAYDELFTGLATLTQRMGRALRGRAERMRTRLETLLARRIFRRPLERVHDLQRRLDELSQRAERSARRRINQARDRAGQRAAQLESLSPLAVLARGYSVTQRAENGAVVRRSDEVAPGERLRTRFASGQAVSRVEEVDP